MRLRIPFTDTVLGGRTRGESAGSTSDMAQKLDKVWRVCEQARRPHEPGWLANARYLAGNQWDPDEADARGMASRRVPTPIPDKRVKVTDNFVYALVRQAQSNLVDNLGRQLAIPATNSPVDALSAELGTDVLEYDYERAQERSRRLREVLYAMVMGRCLRGVDWDPDAEGQGLKGPLPRAGEIRNRTLSQLQFYVDPWHDSWEEASFVIEVSIVDIEEVKEMFGVEVEPERYVDTTNMIDQMLGLVPGQQNTRTPEREHSCLLKKISFRPTPKNPKGLVEYWVGARHLHETTLPDGLFPYVALDWFRMFGPYPLPFVTPLRDPQKKYNILLSQVIELANRQLRGDILIRGAGEVTEEEEEDSDRKVIRLDSSVEEFQLFPYNLNPTQAEWAIAEMWNGAQRAAGIRAAMLGENPAGVGTVGQLMLLKEADVAGLAFFRAGFDDSYARIGHLKLQVARNHYKAPRLLRISGPDHKTQVDTFLGEQLEGVANVVTKSLPAMTEMEQRRRREELADKGCWGPFLDPANGQYSLQVKRARMLDLRNSGIPDIQHEVDALIAPDSWEQFLVRCRQDEIEQEQFVRGARRLQAVAMIQKVTPQPQGPPVAEPGAEAPSTEEQAVAAVSGQ